MEYTTISQEEENKAECLNVSKLYTEAIFLYGKQMQTDVAMEEMGELIQALVKYRRNRSNENLIHILEEIADVQIVLDQLKYMYDYAGDVPKIQFEKQKRLRSMIDSEFKRSLLS